MITITKPGLYPALSAADYHADPCPAPSLSSTIAKLLCLSSPLHAQLAHPRLTPDAPRGDAEAYDIGTAAHAVFLEGTNVVSVVDADDWRTKAAREQRDAIRLEGRVPLLAHQYARVLALTSALRERLDEHTDGAAMFTQGQAEQTAVWQEDGLWCRARFDWLRPGAIDDLKTVSGTANPESVSRGLFALGYDIQAAWYLRGLAAVRPEHGPQRTTFRFAFVETQPPYAVSVVGLGPDALMLAEKKVLYALETWRTCLETGEWPGYAARTCWATLPTWEETRWLTKELDGGSLSA